MSTTNDKNFIIQDIQECNIPSVIKAQFSELQRLRNNVDTAERKASLAMESARGAKEKSTGLFQKKEAIESLQNAVVDIADAQVAVTDAQEVSFRYQQKLGEFCKYLFGLGVSNIAANRSVVRELEMRLRGASEEELDELARQEIAGVIRQLKAQEDIMKKQKDLSGKVKAHDEALTDLIMKSDEYAEQIRDGQKKNVAQDNEISHQVEKGKEHDRRLDASDEKNQAQDKELSRQADKDAEHDRRLDAGDVKDQAQDEELQRRIEADSEQDRHLREIDETDLVQNEKLRTLYDLSESQSQQISDLQHKVASLEVLCDSLNTQIINNDNKRREMETVLSEKIDSRFTRKASIVSAIVGVLGLIAAIIGFLI